MSTSQNIDTDPRVTLPDDQMLELGMTRYHASQDLIREQRDDWAHWDRLYLNYVPRTDWPFDTNLRIPATFSTIESFLPRLTSQRPRIKIDARNDEDIETAQVHRELLDYQWDYVGMNTKMIEFVKTGLIKGTAIGKLQWMRKIQTKTFRQRVPTAAGTTQVFETEEDVRVYDDPVFDIIRLEDFLIDPTACSIEDSRYCIHRIRMTWDEIDAWAEATGNAEGEEFGDGWDWNKKAIRDLKDVKPVTDADTDIEKRELAATRGLGDPEPTKQRAEIFEFEVLEYWEDQRMCVMVREPEVILLNQRNPYWHQKKPFVRFVDNLVPGSFHGLGECELLESMNMELDDVHNLRLESAKRKIMQMFKVRRGSPPDNQEIKFKPQGKIPVNQPDDITVLFDQDVPASSYREEDVLRLWIQEASGATDVFKGLATPIGNETATGASLLAQSANSRASIKFQQLVEMTLRPLAEMWIALNEQFIDQERVIQIVGPEGMLRKPISPQDIARSGSDLDVRIDIGATDPVNRELKLQRTINALQVVAQIPPEAAGTPQMQAIMKRLFDLMDLPQVQAQAAPPGAAPASAPGGGLGAAGGQSAAGEIANSLSPTTEGTFGPTTTATQ